MFYVLRIHHIDKNNPSLNLLLIRLPLAWRWTTQKKGIERCLFVKSWLCCVNTDYRMPSLTLAAHLAVLRFRIFHSSPCVQCDSPSIHTSWLIKSRRHFEWWVLLSRNESKSSLEIITIKFKHFHLSVSALRRQLKALAALRLPLCQLLLLLLLLRWRRWTQWTQKKPSSSHRLWLSRWDHYWQHSVELSTVNPVLTFLHILESIISL